jgi:hypothetical protein
MLGLAPSVALRGLSAQRHRRRQRQQTGGQTAVAVALSLAVSRGRRPVSYQALRRRRVHVKGALDRRRTRNTTAGIRWPDVVGSTKEYILVGRRRA